MLLGKQNDPRPLLTPTDDREDGQYVVDYAANLFPPKDCSGRLGHPDG